MTFEEWWKDVGGKWQPTELRLDTARAAWQAATNNVMAHVKEAEYAMVGGNIIKENIGWDTADGWFRWIYKKVWGE